MAISPEELQARWLELRQLVTDLSPAELALRVDELLGLGPAQTEPGFRLESSADWGQTQADGQPPPRGPRPPRPVGDTLITPSTAPPPPVQRDLPRVPGYDLLRELGRGGMGVVYLARQKGLERVVALKMLLSGQFAAVEQETRFRREAQAAAKLVHPHIVQVHEIGEHEGRWYFSLEYVDGPSLDERIAGQPQPPRPAAQLVATLARAVHFAHLQGILHRDLKPANVLLAAAATPAQDAGEPAGYGTPKITDFGLAKRLEEEAGDTRTGDIIGTPSYMPPEQASGRQVQLGPAADVYALGAILYEMLTGRPPFRGVTPVDTVMQVLREPAVSPRRLVPQVPKDLETICLKCLHKEPSGRYLTAQELADDLERFLNHEPICARPATLIERLVSWGKRNPTKVLIVALAVLGVVRIVSVDVIYRSTQLQKAKETAEQVALNALDHAKNLDQKLRTQRAWLVDTWMARARTPAEVGEALRQLAEMDDRDGAWLVELAGRAVKLAPRLGEEPAALSALGLLRRAEAAGWFTPQRLGSFDADPTFTPLRTRSDFQAWRRSLGDL